MHLINHPVDCPICDQAGECGLQDQYMDYGLYDSQVAQADKVHKAKVQVIGPRGDPGRGALRAVQPLRPLLRRGHEDRRAGHLQPRRPRRDRRRARAAQLDNAYSLNTVDICPVGALTSRDFRFQKRVWMLKSADSVCPGCATGCNVRVDHEAGRIYRLKPRRNAEVNGSWMCDEGRLTYKAVHEDRPPGDPLWRGAGRCAWAEVQAHLAKVAPAASRW